MAARRGFYSNIIVYDERRRYYYMNPQKNKPFLDDEIRDMGIGLLDQTRRAVQSSFGDVASPYIEYSGAYSTVDSFRVRQASDNDRNFLVKGGSSLDHPAVLYAKGFYIFLTEDIEYKHQQYSSDTIDLQTQADKSLTLTPIPALTTPAVDRIDIVYVDLHFEEVTAASGTDSSVYKDTGLKNPVVGTETANRLRAVIDIKVREGWDTTNPSYGPITKNIFDHSEFLGGITSNDIDPTDNHYKIPIAVIYRDAFQNVINDSQIVDLLSLYNKRVMNMSELSYRAKHGGYTATGVYELGLTGFTPQFLSVKVDEGAFATGLNQGFGSEALNTNSVTPRILDNNGNFFIRGLMVGHDTGIVTYATGPESLGVGEIIVQDLSARSIYAGYGVTGITGMREYKDSVSVVVKGDTGHGGLSVMNMDGVTGSKTAYMRAVHGGAQENFFVVDYKGRVGLNTDTPGWDKPLSWENTDRYNDGLGGASGVNIVQDVNGSLRIRDHVFVDKDVYVNRDLFGKTWKIPESLSDQSPAMFGFTGIPSEGFTGIAGSISSVIFKRGIAVMGDTGIVAYGYTGIGAAGQYECFDSEGRRMFTIGDLGDDFNRIIKTLYGMSLRKSFTSDSSFLSFSGPLFSGPLLTGDLVSYDIVLEGGTHITGNLTIVNGSMDGVEEIRNHILSNPDFINGYTRTYTYTFYFVDGTSELRTGTALGVQILLDPFGFSLGFDNHGRIILKDMPEDPVHVTLDSVASFTVNRLSVTPDPVYITFTEGSYYGAVEYGGSLDNLKFAKLDLGEAADAWLFNGDVYFNGNGLMDRVTFSPNAMFRNDVFVYGTLFADQQFFNFANVQNLLVRSNFNVLNQGEIVNGLGIGEFSLSDLNLLRADTVKYPDLLMYVSGKMMSKSIEVRDITTSATTLGSIKQTSVQDSGKAYVDIGGTVDGTATPYGIHLVDNRTGVTDTDSFKEMVLDASDGNGNYREARLRIKGDLTTDRYFIASFLGAGDISEINTDYKFQVNGRALINDTLEVKALRFIGAEAPEGNQDIITPQNVSVIGKVSAQTSSTGEDIQNNQVILREKKFTSNKRIYLENLGYLGVGAAWTGIVMDPEPAQVYYDTYIKPTFTPSSIPTARWAFDGVSYTEEQFNDIVGVEANEIIVSNIPDSLEGYKKYKCERTTIATLGTLFIEWSGFKFSPTAPVSNVISSYYFQSPYFRNRDGGQTIDWFPGASRFGDDNLLVRVYGDIIDTSTTVPSIYKIDQSLGVYIPLDKWWQYYTAVDSNNYRSLAVFYPYEHVMDTFNSASFSKQTSSTDEFGDPKWKLALYPRLVEQTRVPVGSNFDKIYRGQWDLDVCILPENTGRCANLIGKLYISYMQS